MATHIESGTTTWWRNRHLMFLALLLGAAAWFAYDGYYAYPAENRRWAAQAMGVAPDSYELNPRLTQAALRDVAQQAQGGTPTMGQVSERFGEPTLVRDENEVWYVGPDAYLKLSVADGSLKAESYKATHELSSMKMQKLFALGLLIISVYLAVRLVRVMTTRVVLDESGLRYNSRHIAWDDMTGLRHDDFARKGWVDLEYKAAGAQRSFRLDSYHIAKFEEIVSALCERKGFSSPVGVPGEAEAGQAGEEK